MRASAMDRATWEARRQASRDLAVRLSARAQAQAQALAYAQARAISKRLQRAGALGGRRRAEVLSPERRQEIARMGAHARAMKWSKVP